MIEFGTGGWRAIIAEGFTKQNVLLLGQGLAKRMLQEGVAERGIVIGYDRRFLSRESAWWLTQVMVANNIPVTIIDRAAPTPMIMFTVRDKDCAYGMAVTASHNPALYNGIKVFTAGGRDADAEVTGSLQTQVNAVTLFQNDRAGQVSGHERRRLKRGFPDIQRIDPPCPAQRPGNAQTLIPRALIRRHRAMHGRMEPMRQAKRMQALP